MIACEQGFLKAFDVLEQLINQVRNAGEKQQRLDEVERLVFGELLTMGLHILRGFVANAGNGDVGETFEMTAATTDTSADADATTLPARVLRRLKELHSRRYMSIFGELQITRFVYGTREGQKIEVSPLDVKLGLPAGDFSYVLEDWLQRLCVKESFGEATTDLKELLGVASSVRAAEVMNRNMAEFASSFGENQPPPPADEEGEIIVFTADGKGVPMRRPTGEKAPHGQRRKKGQKANKKQMSYVGAVYTIDRFTRTPEDVLEEILRENTSAQRPEPQHKRVSAEMTQIMEGEECNGRVSLFGKLSEEVASRNPQ